MDVRPVKMNVNSSKIEQSYNTNQDERKAFKLELFESFNSYKQPEN